MGGTLGRRFHMRTMSVAEIKGRSKPTNKDRLPRPGSVPRKVYDALMKRPGYPTSLKRIIDKHGQTTVSRSISDLTDYYGCDIAYAGKITGSRRTRAGTAEYVITGEWKGSRYFDYLKKRFLNEEEG
jgi:hypothetical protein